MPPALRALEFLPSGTALPSFPLRRGDGTPASTDDLKGRPVVLNFWATWCAPCVEELPSLRQLSLAASDLRVVLVNEDRGTPQIGRFLSRLGVQDLASYLDGEGVLARTLGVRALPTTFLVDSGLVPRARLNGAARWGDAAVVGFLREFLGGS